MKKLLFLMLYGLISQYGIAQQANISGTFSHLTDQDSVQLIIYKYGKFPVSIPEFKTLYSVKVSNHKFHFTILVTGKRPYEYSLQIPRQRLLINLENLIVEKGDDIQITGNDFVIKEFKGRGSEKLNVIRNLNALDTATQKQTFSTTYTDLQNVIVAGNKHTITADKYLKSQKKHLSNMVYQMLRFRIDYQMTGVYYSLVYMNARDSIRNALTHFWLPERHKYRFLQPFTTGEYSTEFTLSTINDFAINEIVKNNDYSTLFYRRGLKKIYTHLKANYTGDIREKLITYTILSASGSNDLKECYEDALKYVKNAEFKTALINHCQVIPGSPAYDFNLPDTNLIVHHLSDYKGKVVVLDFWFTGCGNCRKLTPILRNIEDHYKNNDDVIFISISSDKELKNWKAGIKSGFYTTSPEEINLFTAGKGRYDPFYQKSNIQAAPTLRIIDKYGNWCENPVKYGSDNGEDLITRINQALNK
ncbi:TlpA family protein disulfide reductase [Mucilaginibacter gossypii]|uniref:Thioredoxin-like n=1 Tax=Mucilaginibacter gossypii TaxID=551996 RepID=A0A1G8B999_9SPHI|nr:TlpA disulfide reductase family protein [Mucilaginibacter gossypii]SDH29684.1 Thioredoxin-like [Mucilaginibacter gossypii]